MVGIFDLQQMDKRVFIQRHLLLAGDHREDLQEVFLARPVDLDLEEDPPQGRPVEDLVRVEVGREDHQRVEGHLEFFARLQRQDVAAFLQRHDPAVDDLLRRFRLTAKVVDDEDAAGGFQLQRRLIGARGGVVGQVEHVERQFAARDDGRAFAEDIAVVEAVRSAAQAFGSSTASSAAECTIGS